MDQGKLIIFEGPDGVGKTTLSKTISEHINNLGEACELLSFPGREPGTLGWLVYEIHHKLPEYGVESITPAGKQALHIAAHLDAIERRIIPTLVGGTHILLDRYWWSTWVYGVVSGIERRVLSRMINLERAQWKGFKPSAVFLIERTAPIDRNDNLEQWERLRYEYQELAQAEGKRYPVYTVSNNNSFEMTVETLKGLLQRVLDTPSAAPNN